MTLPPIKFADVLIDGVEPEKEVWEFCFRNYLTYAPERRREVFARDVQKMQSLVDHLAFDLGMGADSMKVLEGLDERAMTWRRWVGLQKVAGVVDLVRRENPEKLVVFCCFKDAMTEIHSALRADLGALIVYNNTEPDRRATVLNKFEKRAGNQVLVIHRDIAEFSPGALSFTHCDRMLFVEADWNPEIDAAAVMRMWKRGQKSKCEVRFAGLRGSIDAKIQRVLKQHTRRIVTGFYDDKEGSTEPAANPFEE